MEYKRVASEHERATREYIKEISLSGGAERRGLSRQEVTCYHKLGVYIYEYIATRLWEFSRATMTKRVYSIRYTFLMCPTSHARLVRLPAQPPIDHGKVLPSLLLFCGRIYLHSLIRHF